MLSNLVVLPKFLRLDDECFLRLSELQFNSNINVFMLGYVYVTALGYGLYCHKYICIIGDSDTHSVLDSFYHIAKPLQLPMV